MCHRGQASRNNDLRCDKAGGTMTEAWKSHAIVIVPPHLHTLEHRCDEKYGVIVSYCRPTV